MDERSPQAKPIALPRHSRPRLRRGFCKRGGEPATGARRAPWSNQVYDLGRCMFNIFSQSVKYIIWPASGAAQITPSINLRRHSQRRIRVLPRSRSCGVCLERAGHRR